MRLPISIVGAIVLAVLVAGCAPTNISELVKAMGQDPATVCVTATYAGALINVARTNITNGDVQCNGNGLAVKSQATQLGVPMVVTPQLSIGQPTLVPPPPAVLPQPQPQPNKPDPSPPRSQGPADRKSSERLAELLRDMPR